MNNMVVINNSKLRVKEYRGLRVATMWDVASVHGVRPDVIRDNFENNSNHMTEGKHYFRMNKYSEFAQDLIRSGEMSQNQLNAVKDIPLFTEKGYLMIVKPLQGETAWKVQEQMIDNYFTVMNTLSNLSPQLQLLINMELEQRKLQQAVQETKEEIAAVREIITINPKAEWRKQTNTILNKIGKALGNYKSPKDEAYNALKERGKCRPDILVTNLKQRALMNGMAKSKVDELNILDVLENELRLKEIYITIVKEMAIKHGVRVENN